MRRGLIALSKVELPDAVLDARVARARAAAAAAGLDVLLAYTNNTRTAAVSWLTGFVPYWSEALLVLPRDGDPTLVVALTNRVRTWIERTSRVAAVVPSPRMAEEARCLIAKAKPDARVGIVEFDDLPARLAADLGAGALLLSDATELFAALRARPDPAEIALAAKAGAIAHRALSRLSHPDTTLEAAIAAVEHEARRLGAEEIYIAAAPDLERDRRLRRLEGATRPGARFAVRATVAYKGSWIRLTRTVCRDAGAAERAAEEFAAAVARLPDPSLLAAFPSWLVEGCRSGQPLQSLAGSRIEAPLPLGEGALVTAQAVVEVAGRPVAIAAPALLGAAGEAASLLADPLFEDGSPSAALSPD